MRNLFLIPTLLATVLGTASMAQADGQMIRVWRGYKRGDLNDTVMLKRLNESLIPATATLGSERTSIKGYLPVVLPKLRAVKVPDELALVTYDSTDKYLAYRETPAGKRYTELHWDIFDKTTSSSAVASDFKGTAEIGKAYLLTAYTGRWDGAYARFSLFRRDKKLSDEAYTKAVANWLRMRNNDGVDDTAQPPQGKLGRVVLVEKEFVAAYDLWSSREAWQERNNDDMGDPRDFDNYSIKEYGIGTMDLDIELPKGLPALQRRQGTQAPLSP